MSNSPVLMCRDVAKTYRQGPEAVSVLQGVDLSIERAERVAIIGASGSGKSTLLNILGGLHTPDTGEVKVAGQNLSGLSDNARGRLRNQALGFVYQFHHLLPEFTALENVAMPLVIGKLSPAQAQERARAMLASVGLESRVGHKPSALSGGERQRVAIARALVTEPACVLMDEPTGNLDTHTAADIQALIKSLNTRIGISFIIVTHDLNLAAQMDRTLTLHEGTLTATPSATQVEQSV
ncbi:lipoprotein-releasing ABC transporter ATP-binding protein LolD [Gilvimarinus agarilyticus]|uniref:lipoprotein-releasing ABC transporter ATP-binding protein LolD n=1 Tax=Gilvimarinus sp. 2_MG-2023 TaxID=3062666 RepID=UPI001C08A4C0|nr:lipoprotein-releasing ABC transporter ATP-binding protein LolD [Gilvimarinus sp. 2_MG-2023]MBU2887430.1 lipoprotein-releasing ABC transporter ATP-binding protein LolD [Gilvimarinus agarilyticus]MDO6572089.1 lipoprotein-releasing ABC transporter ATP-binding protein LolD [Gilvimarinus sp. 2_MG-2023]